MNMHGLMTPDFADTIRPPSRVREVIRWLTKHYMFLVIVIVPTFLTTGYFFGLASNQYSSEAHFLVRGSDSGTVPSVSGGLTQMLNLAGGTSVSQSGAMSVADYLTSHDAVAALRKDGQLVERYSLPQIDFISRLHVTGLTPERLLKYYQRMIKVDFDTETGITTLSVRGFRPIDSYQLVEKLLSLGEARVNALNKRSYNDSIRFAQQQLADAEVALTTNQLQMTHFRQSRSDIDPTATGQSQIGLVRSLTERLATARAQLGAMRRAINPDSPQMRAMTASVQALEGQVAAQSAVLTGSDTAIAADIGGYEKLKLREELLSKRYEAAAASLSLARQQAQRQQLYIVHVVQPNMPVKSLYPERWRICGTVLLGSLLLYSIGWLLAAGVREHAA